MCEDDQSIHNTKISCVQIMVFDYVGQGLWVIANVLRMQQSFF